MSSDAPHIPTANEGIPLDASEKLMLGFQRYARLSSAGGIMLIITTIIALFWANSQFSGIYNHIFHEMEFSLGIGKWHLPIHTVGHFINDAIMAIFFLLVGLEIKREVLVGELHSPKKAALPIFAAIGGMVVPAAIYAVINLGSPESMHGWGIPMATDIAFALGILALLGKRAPLSLKIFVTSLAIVDDLGALIVIALFYTDDLALNYLGMAGITVGVLFALNFLKFRNPVFYILPGIVLWYFVLMSGVHATIAGVLLAMTIPASARVDRVRFLKASHHALHHFDKAGDDGTTPAESSAQRAAAFALKKNITLVLPPLHRIEHALEPWSAFAIIPIFAIANAGLHLSESLGDAIGEPVTLGVFFGLILGKPAGIVLASFIGVKLGMCALPKGVSWKHIIGAGCLGGIGFTMALFISNLAFANSTVHLDDAKLGILSASVVSTILGLGILATCKPAEDADTPDNYKDSGSGPLHPFLEQHKSTGPDTNEPIARAKAS